MARFARLAAWLVLLLAWPAQAQEQRQGVAQHVLEAQWRMEPGAGWDAPATAPAAVMDGAGWQAVALPHHRPRGLSAADRPEVAWYRLPVAPGATHLYLPRWQTIGTVAVYADGRLVYRSRGSRLSVSFNRPLWVPLADMSAGPPPTAVLIRMAGMEGVGGAISTAWTGTQDALLWRYRVRSWLQTDLIGLTAASFVVIGLFSLAVWCVRRRESLYALFFAASVINALRTLHYVTGDLPPVLPDDWFGWITVNSLTWTMVCVFLFSFRVHGQAMPRLARVIAVVVAAQALLTLPVTWGLPRPEAVRPLVYAVTAVLITVVAVLGLRASWRVRSREGLVLSAWLALTVPVGMHDLLLMNYRVSPESLYLAPYGSIGLFAIFLVIAYRRYVGAIRTVEIVNAGLESQLAARERELTASHEQLRALERQQTLAAERQRMMQDMHDGIGSSLMSALRMVQRGQASTADTAQVLKDCIDDLKLAIDSLNPADADLLALLAAVRFRLAPRLKAAGITLVWSVQDLPPLPWLDAQAALHLLRIVQEVLTNVLKHTQASTIDVATALHGGEVLVRIRDDGGAGGGTTPFALPAADTETGAGHGLANVRHRAQALGGRCHWGVWQGGGEFSLWLPLAR